MSPQDRPWSRSELEELIPKAMERLDEAVTELKRLGVRAAETKWAYRKQRAKCFLMADGKNKETREAVAMELLTTSPGEGGVHPGLARDLAANAYTNQRVVIESLREEIATLRTLMVSARGEGR